MKTAAQRIQTADTIELVPQILHLKKILVPTDFSETSKKAVQYALRFAEQFGCEIALLYVVEPATPMIGAPIGVEPFTEKDEFSMAEKDLAALALESHTDRRTFGYFIGARWACAERDHQGCQGP